MISVIITTYKREPALVSRAISSVLKQTYRDIEIIVVDDSPDNYTFREDVKKLVMKYSEINEDVEIRYIAHEKNCGACVARNTGLKNANGEYVAYLDDDDEWLPQKLEKQMRTIESTDAALVYCGYISRDDGTGEEMEKKVEYHKGNVHDILLYKNFIGSTSLPLIRTECLKAIDGFDSRMQSAQDYDVWLRLSAKYIVDYVPEALAIYHEHDGIQISSSPQKKIKGLERINQKNMEYLSTNRELWYRRHIIISPYYAINGEIKRALKTWFRCVQKCPYKIVDNAKYLEQIIKMRKKD